MNALPANRGLPSLNPPASRPHHSVTTLRRNRRVVVLSTKYAVPSATARRSPANRADRRFAKTEQRREPAPGWPKQIAARSRSTADSSLSIIGGRLRLNVATGSPSVGGGV